MIGDVCDRGNDPPDLLALLTQTHNGVGDKFHLILDRIHTADGFANGFLAAPGHLGNLLGIFRDPACLLTGELSRLPDRLNGQSRFSDRGSRFGNSRRHLGGGGQDLG